MAEKKKRWSRKLQTKDRLLHSEEWVQFSLVEIESDVAFDGSRYRLQTPRHPEGLVLDVHSNGRVRISGKSVDLHLVGENLPDQAVLARQARAEKVLQALEGAINWNEPQATQTQRSDQRQAGQTGEGTEGTGRRDLGVRDTEKADQEVELEALDREIQQALEAFEVPATDIPGTPPG